MTNYQPIAFYDSPDKQYHKLYRSHGRIAPVYAPDGKIPSFQIKVPEGVSSIGGAVMVNIATEESNNIAAWLLGNGLVVETFEEEDYGLIVFSNLYNQASLANGDYCLQITAGGSTYYSEIIRVCKNIGFLQLVWSHDDRFELPDMHLSFESQFYFTAYFKSELGKPEYIYEDTIHRRDGLDFPEKIISLKRYQFEDFGAEPFWDGIRLARLFSSIQLLSPVDGTIDVFALEMNVQWDTDGFIGIGTMVLETDNIVKSIGKAMTEPLPLPTPEDVFTLTFDLSAAGTPTITGIILFNQTWHTIENNQVVIQGIPDGDYLYSIQPNYPILGKDGSVTINGADKTVALTLSIDSPYVLEPTPTPTDVGVPVSVVTVALWHDIFENHLITTGMVLLYSAGNYLAAKEIVDIGGGKKGVVFQEVPNTLESGYVYEITVQATNFILKTTDPFEINETQEIDLTLMYFGTEPQPSDIPKMGYLTNDQFVAAGERINLDIIEGNVHEGQQQDVPMPNHPNFPDTMDVKWKHELTGMEEYLEYHMWLAVPISLQEFVLAHYQTIGSVDVYGSFYDVGYVKSMHGYLVYKLDITAPVDLRLRRPLEKIR